MAARKQNKAENFHRGVLVTANSKKGGAVTLNEQHGVRASYATAGIFSRDPKELFYAGIKLPDGRGISLFVNRENGLIVVNVGKSNSKGTSQCVNSHRSF